MCVFVTFEHLLLKTAFEQQLLRTVVDFCQDVIGFVWVTSLLHPPKQTRSHGYIKEHQGTKVLPKYPVVSVIFVDEG